MGYYGGIPDDTPPGCVVVAVLGMIAFIVVLALACNQQTKAIREEWIGKEVVIANTAIEGTVKDYVTHGRDQRNFLVVFKSGGEAEVPTSQVVKKVQAEADRQAKINQLKVEVEAAESAKQAKIRQLEAELQSLKVTK